MFRKNRMELSYVNGTVSDSPSDGEGLSVHVERRKGGAFRKVTVFRIMGCDECSKSVVRAYQKRRMRLEGMSAYRINGGYLFYVNLSRVVRGRFYVDVVDACTLLSSEFTGSKPCEAIFKAARSDNGVSNSVMEVEVHTGDKDSSIRFITSILLSALRIVGVHCKKEEVERLFMSIATV